MPTPGPTGSRVLQLAPVGRRALPFGALAVLRYRGAVRALRALLVGLAVATIAVPPRLAEAKRKDGPTQITPQRQSGKTRRQERRAEELERSEGGARQGVLELTLGSVVLGTSALLIGRGGWEIVEGRRQAEECAAGSDAIACALDPRRNAGIAAGLSFGVAGVLGLAGGFLVTRGVRIRRDYLEWKRAHARLTLHPWATMTRPSGGLALRIRF